LLLPDSEFYSVLSTLPAPDPTNPTTSATYGIVQSAIHSSLEIYEEIVSLTEKEEGETMKSEVDKRRMRLGAPRADELRKVVGREIWSVSKVRDCSKDLTRRRNTHGPIYPATRTLQ
jgi:superkiller protein 3